MNRKIVMHRLDALPEDAVPGFTFAALSNSRDELLQAISTLTPGVLLTDLDHDAAIDEIIAAREVRPEVQIIGAIGVNDLKRVVDAQRAGCSQIVTKPLEPADVCDALSRTVATDAAPTSASFAVIGASGGAGASTIACNLATELAALTGCETLLVDLDFDFGVAAHAFDMTPKYTIADLVQLGEIDPDNLKRCVMELPSPLGVLARPRTHEDATRIEVPHVERILKVARETYPYTVLDVPRQLNEMTGAAIEQADQIVIVFQLTLPSIDNTVRLTESLASGGIDRDRIQLLVNRYRKNVHACTIEMAEQRLNRKVLATVPSDFTSVREAMDVGSNLPSKNPVRVAIANLARQFVGEPGEEAGEAADGSKTWLQRFGLVRSW